MLGVAVTELNILNIVLYLVQWLLFLR